MSVARVSLTHENVGSREFNAFSNPAKGDSYGIQLAIDASDDEISALQELADAVRNASRGGA